MTWWFDLLLLAVAALLWSLGLANQDDTIALFEKILAVAASLVVVLGGRWLPLEIAGLILALYLPSAARVEERHRS
jgi:hypothetical protein